SASTQVQALGAVVQSAPGGWRLPLTADSWQEDATSGARSPPSGLAPGWKDPDISRLERRSLSKLRGRAQRQASVNGPSLLRVSAHNKSASRSREVSAKQHGGADDRSVAAEHPPD